MRTWLEGNQFWMGVASSLAAAGIAAILVKVWAVYSKRAKVSRQEEQARIERLAKKIASSDALLRIEGYFQLLFGVLVYFFGGFVFWAMSDIAAIFNPLFPIALTAVTLLFFFLALRRVSLVLDARRDSVAATADLQIRSAMYGAGDYQRDVTEIIQSRVHDGRLKIQVGNDLGGDPNPGNPKILRVEYRCGGKDYTSTVRESEILRLP